MILMFICGAAVGCAVTAFFAVRELDRRQVDYRDMQDHADKGWDYYQKAANRVGELAVERDALRTRLARNNPRDEKGRFHA